MLDLSLPRDTLYVKSDAGMPGLIHDDDSTLLEELIQESHVVDDPDSPWWRILADLHPKQRAAIEDAAARKTWPKGRRGGGSIGLAAWLFEEYHRWPGYTSLYLALTKEHAKAIIWPALEWMNERYGMGLHFNGHPLELSISAPNGYKVLVRAGKDRSQIEKLRGIYGGLRRAAIDEVGSFGGHDQQLRYLVSSIIVPQFMDTHHLGGGQLVLCGSPGLDPRGFYYEKCTGNDHSGKAVQAWSSHRWTSLDNPYLDAVGYLTEELSNGDYIVDETPVADVVAALVALKDTPITDEAWAPVLARLTAEFRREYLADWVKDTDSLVYVPTERNMLPDGWELPRDVPWRIVIVVDPGWGDGNGFAVAAKSLRSRDIVLLKAYYVPELDDDQIAEELKALRTAWRSSEIYADCGGEGDRFVQNMSNRGVIVQALGKPRKKPRIEYLRALIKTAALRIRRDHCSDVLSEWSALPWSEDRQSHREGFVDDVADAVLGAVNQLSQLFVAAAPPRPKPGEAGYDAYAERLEKAAAVRAGKRMLRRKRA
jgi:hypothetical protein